MWCIQGNKSLFAPSWTWACVLLFMMQPQSWNQTTNILWNHTPNTKDAETLNWNKNCVRPAASVCWPCEDFVSHPDRRRRITPPLSETHTHVLSMATEKSPAVGGKTEFTTCASIKQPCKEDIKTAICIQATHAHTSFLHKAHKDLSSPAVTALCAPSTVADWTHLSSIFPSQ